MCLNLVKQFNSFYLLDEYGLIGRGKSNISFTQRSFQRADLENELSLLEVIKTVKPTVLLGLSGKGGLFTEEIIKEMHKYCARPIIFPMSNPTHHSECTAEQAYTWTDGNCIFASGSPFDPVTINGRDNITSTHLKEKHLAQAKAIICSSFLELDLPRQPQKVITKHDKLTLLAKRVSYRMLNQAAIALANSLTVEELANGSVYPSVDRIRDVSLEVAVAGKHALS